MKTPREVLLGRHRAVEPRLDQIRRRVVAGIARPKTAPAWESPMHDLPWPVAALLRPWRELVFANRVIWASLAAVWVVILALNLATREAEQPAEMRFSPPSPSQMLLALKQKQMLLTELAGMSEPAAGGRPEAILPRPRSERRTETLNT